MIDPITALAQVPGIRFRFDLSPIAVQIISASFASLRADRSQLHRRKLSACQGHAAAVACVTTQMYQGNLRPLRVRLAIRCARADRPHSVEEQRPLAHFLVQICAIIGGIGACACTALASAHARSRSRTLARARTQARANMIDIYG